MKYLAIILALAMAMPDAIRMADLAPLPKRKPAQDGGR